MIAVGLIAGAAYIGMGLYLSFGRVGKRNKVYRDHGWLR